MKSRFPKKILAFFFPISILLGAGYIFIANNLQNYEHDRLREWSEDFTQIESDFFKVRRNVQTFILNNKQAAEIGEKVANNNFKTITSDFRKLYNSIEQAHKDSELIQPKQYQEFVKSINEYDNSVLEIKDQFSLYNDKVNDTPRKYLKSYLELKSLLKELKQKKLLKNLEQFLKLSKEYIQTNSSETLSQLRYSIESLEENIENVKKQNQQRLIRDHFGRMQKVFFNYIEISNLLGLNSDSSGLIAQVLYEEKQIEDTLKQLKNLSLKTISKNIRNTTNLFHAFSFILFFGLLFTALFKITLEEKLIHEFEDAIYKKTVDPEYDINDYDLPIKYKTALSLLNKGNIGDFEGLWQAITHLSNEYLFIVNTDAEIVTHSENISNFITRDETGGLPSIINLLNRDDWIKISKTKITEDEIGTISHTVLKDNMKRELHVSLKFCSIYMNNRLHFLLIADDLTNQMIADERLKNVSDEARKLNKSKNTFIANMGHELRTPLNSIISYAQLIKKSALANEINQESARRDGDKIVNSGIKLLNMINDILDFAKLEAGQELVERHEFIFDDFVNELKKIFEREPNDKDNKIVFHNNVKLQKISSDRLKLKKSICAIVRHSIETTDNGIISVSFDLSENDLFITIKDTGQGISSDQLKNLFKPFDEISSRNEYQKLGTSLGLTITKKYTDLLSGSIAIESEPNSGTTYKVFLPLHQSNGIARPVLTEVKEEKILESAPGKTPVILVIDDDPKSQEIISRYLREQDIQVVTASTGKEGLMLAKELRPQLITMDVRLPDIEGWSLIGALKNELRTKDIPVIFISILNEVQKGITLGATDYLVKPIDPSRLLNVIEKYAYKDTRPILVVDDIESNREILCRSLEELGKSFIEAENGKKALESLTTMTPSLILLDLMMPVMDGFTFLNEIKQNPVWKNIPIIIVTARELSELEKRRLGESVDKIISKGNLGVNYLVNEIKDFMDQHSSFNKH